jgi:hypothetical protein
MQPLQHILFFFCKQNKLFIMSENITNTTIIFYDYLDNIKIHNIKQVYIYILTNLNYASQPSWFTYK